MLLQYKTLKKALFNFIKNTSQVFGETSQM